jgi:YidC/Oxa1 family membrane protein insertase
VKVNLSLNDIIPPLGSVQVDVHAIGERIEGLVYTLADAAAVVATDPVAGSATDATAQKNGGWFGFIADAMELVLKVNSIYL